MAPVVEATAEATARLARTNLEQSRDWFEAQNIYFAQKLTSWT
jgi:hypothetical protein